MEVAETPTTERGAFGIRYLPEPGDDADVGGRPSLLTPELAKLIADEVRAGAKPKRAAALCGVKRTTWHRWIAHHEAGAQPYAMLVGSILLAQDAFDAITEQRIAKAPEWQAAAWILKTRHRKEYGDKVEVKNDAREVTQISREELVAIAFGKGTNDPG